MESSAWPQGALAAAPQDLAVSAMKGSDANDCTPANPCATIQRALQVAGTAPSTIVVHGGTYAGPVTIAAGEQVTLLGSSNDQVTITAPSDGSSAPAVTNDGTLALANIELGGDGSVALEQDGGELSLSSVSTPYGGAVQIDGGSAGLNAPSNDADEGVNLVLNSGSLLISHTDDFATLTQTGGRLVLDSVYRYSGSSPIQISGGSALIQDSEIAEAQDNPLAVTGDGDVTVERSVFIQSAPSVDGANASLTLIASSVFEPQNSLAATDGGQLRMAATVLDDGGQSACSGPVVDGGYNSSFDNSCGFTAPGSRNHAARQQLFPAFNPNNDLWNYSGPPTIYTPINGLVGRSATGQKVPNQLINAIPVGAVATFDPGIALCQAGTTSDQIGQAAPVGPGCDIGAIELGPSATTLTASRRTAVTGQPVTLTAHVATPYSPQFLLAGVTFTQAGHRIPACTGLSLDAISEARCTLIPTPGTHTYSAVFESSGDALPSASAPRNVTVARAPVTVALTIHDTGSGAQATIHGTIDNTRTLEAVADVTAQLYTDVASHWQRVGHAMRSNTAGIVYETTTVHPHTRYQLRTTTSHAYLAGTSKTVTTARSRTAREH